MATIIQGSDRTLRIHLKKSNGEPLDLTACTAIAAKFLDDNGEVVERTLEDGEIAIVSPSGAGLIDVTLAANFTSALKIAERQDFDLHITISGSLRKVRLYESLTVEADLGD